MKKRLIITSTILLISLANYFGIIYDGSVRAVEFLSIFAVGAMVGVLLTQIILTSKNKSKTS